MVKKILYLLIFLGLPQVAFALNVEILQTDPAPIVAGDYADITLRFTASEIDESQINNLRISLDETSFVTPVYPSEETLSVLFSGEVYTTTFRAFFSEDIEQGVVVFPIRMSYEGVTQIEDLEVFVEENKKSPQLFIGNLETVPSEILPDSDNNKLMVTLQNLGDKDAELLSVKLVPKSSLIDESYAYSLIDSVSSIEGGSEEVLEFTIDVEEGAQGILEAELEVNYRAEKAVGNSFQTFVETIPISIPITGAPFLVVESVEQLDSFTAGTTENRIRMVIRNDGIEEAEDVRVRVQPDISYPFIYEVTSEYVGASIKPGESATIQFKAEVTKDAEVRDYPTRVLLESMVQEARYTQDDVVVVTVTQEQRRSNNQIGIILLGLIVVVSVGFGVVRYVSWQNRKKK